MIAYLYRLLNLTAQVCPYVMKISRRYLKSTLLYQGNVEDALHSTDALANEDANEGEHHGLAADESKGTTESGKRKKAKGSGAKAANKRGKAGKAASAVVRVGLCCVIGIHSCLISSRLRYSRMML